MTDGNQNAAGHGLHNERPRITVCICTHNRPEYLRDCLDGLEAQSVGPRGFDILVVDSGSRPEPAARIADIVARTPRASLLRVDQPGLSLARNRAAAAVRTGYIAYLDDDAIPSIDWIAAIRNVLSAKIGAPAMLGGAIRPLWEAPFPRWWPTQLKGLLSIIEVEGTGEYRHAGVARTLEPYGANMIIDVARLLATGGFVETIGRVGEKLLSDEEKVLAWRLQELGHSVRYDSSIVVHHQIQADRLTVHWLLARIYWQGVSRVRSSRRIAPTAGLLAEAIRRVIVVLILAPVAVVPSSRVWLIGLRWRWFYARGFLRAFLCDPAEVNDAPMVREAVLSDRSNSFNHVGVPLRTP